MELGGIPAHPHSTSPAEGRGLECWTVAGSARAGDPEGVKLGNLCLLPPPQRGRGAVSETNALFLPKCQRMAGTVLGDPASSPGNA